MGKRNERFSVDEKVVILFNPKKTLNIGTLYNGVSVPDANGEVTMSWVRYNDGLLPPTGINISDVFATPVIGGRVIDPNMPMGQIDFGIPVDAFNGKSSIYIPSYYRTRAYIFEMPRDIDRLRDYWYCVNGVGVNAISYVAESTSVNKSITATVIKRGFKDLSNRYGWKGLAYSNKFEETITFSLPANTPVWKLQQLVRSSAVAVVGNNVLTLDIVDTPYYNYFFQNDAGSLNPIVRMISIVTNSLNFNKRRNQFEIQAVILG